MAASTLRACAFVPVVMALKYKFAVRIRCDEHGAMPGDVSVPVRVTDKHVVETIRNRAGEGFADMLPAADWRLPRSIAEPFDK